MQVSDDANYYRNRHLRASGRPAPAADQPAISF
jgi:hypothetical protein